MTHPTQEDDVKAIRDALALGPDSAFYTHHRDSNKWQENEALALACNPERIARLLARLEQAERDAGRYQLLRRGQHWSVIDGIGDPLRAEVLDEAIDAHIAAIASEAGK